MRLARRLPTSTEENVQKLVIRHVFSSREEVATAASRQAGKVLHSAMSAHGLARFVAASGASQIRLLELLTQDPSIDWSRVWLFHLDEYIGLHADHPGSMQRYVRDHIVRPTGLRHAYLLDGQEIAESVGKAADALGQAADLTIVGVGNNGHLAFNDPPADFRTEEPFIEVRLSEESRQQQLAGGWFRTYAEVPVRAVTMSVRQILRSRSLIAVAMGLHKAHAVKRCFSGDVDEYAPASAIQLHPDSHLYLDEAAASLL